MAIATTNKSKGAPRPPASGKPSWLRRIRSAPARIRIFFHEVLQELRKSVWPSRDELKESTAVVILSVLLVAFWVWICDLVFQFILQRVI